jgi:hypothetical protein
MELFLFVVGCGIAVMIVEFLVSAKDRFNEILEQDEQDEK